MQRVIQNSDHHPIKTLGSQGENFIVTYCGMYDSF